MISWPCWTVRTSGWSGAAETESVLSQLPNVITVLRILLVIPTGWLLLETRYVDALGLMAVAGASDALDGWMARRFGWISQFGAAMDPVADKLLVAVTFIIFTLQGYIPMVLHPNPRRVAQIGFGSGETTRVGLEYGIV